MIFALLATAVFLRVQQQDRVTPDLNFETIPGVEVGLFAESPMLFNPTSIDVDELGRVWVAEAVNYRQWDGRNPGRHHEEGDRIVVLQDTDGDGVADSSTVFAQDKDLTAPLGIAVIGNEVYVSCSPNLFIYRDLDGDLKADEREVFLTGFGGFDHDHGLHSVVPHPSGDLLWCAGNAGPHVVTDRGGFTLRSGSMYNGGGPTNAGNRAGLRSDDGRLWTGGLIGRIGQNGQSMQVLAHNFRNEYEVAVDSFGLMYTFDNDDDGNQGCRVICLTPGGDYGFFGSNGSRTWQADRREGQSTFEAHWHQGDPGVMPAGTNTGAGGPCGVTVYERYEIAALTGHVLTADAGRSQVFDFTPEVHGAQVKLIESVLLQPGLDSGGKRGHWFRPSDVTSGPDGTIYVADWYDPGVGGHAAGDREAYGRILRLSPDDESGAPEPSSRNEDPWPRTQLERKALASGLEAKVAQSAWKAIARSDFPPDVDAALNGPLAEAKNHSSARVRLAALEACLSAGLPAQEVIGHFTKDPSALVRARAATRLEPVPWAGCGALLIDLALQYDGQDRAYLESIGIGARHKESELYLALLQLLEPAKDRALIRDFAWRLHPAEAFALLQSEATQQGADIAIRRKCLDAIAFMPERQAAEFMVGQALAGANDVREYASQWIENRSTNLWSEFGLKGSLGGELDSAEELWRSGMVTETGVSAEVDMRNVTNLWLVVEDGGNGNGCDWADWIEPTLTTARGSQSLQEIPWFQAKAGWGSIHWGKNCNAGDLRVNGLAFENAIGTHAPSRIGFTLPHDAITLKVTCAPDDGGRQGSSRPSVRFAIYGEKRIDPAVQQALRLAASGGDESAAENLLHSVSGALFLLDQARQDKLPSGLREWVKGRLQTHEDLSVRALASEVFPLTTTGGATLPSLSEIAAMPGDESRGRELFRGRATCFACHTMEGLGGNIGPDLSAIHQKYDREGILNALVHPSASLAFGYDNWTLQLRDGRTLSGSILADGESIVLRDLAGKRSVIDATQVTSRHKSSVSTMPSALALGLGVQDLADIATFLTTDPKTQPEFGEAIELFNGRNLDGWDHFLDNGGERDAVWSVKDGVLRCEGRPAGYLFTRAAFTNFELTLEWRGDPTVGPGNSGVLLRVHTPHKVWPRSIEAQLESGNAGDIWNIDEFPMLVDKARTSGRHTQKLMPSNEKPLGQWNHYRIRLDHSRLTLEVNGQRQNTALWCAELPGVIALQSEGVPIEFRKIRLTPIR